MEDFTTFCKEWKLQTQIVSDIGGRPNMEDVWNAQIIRGGLFVVVCDGHGGKECAEFTAKNLPEYFNHELKSKKTRIRTALAHAIDAVVDNWNRTCFGKTGVPKNEHKRDAFFDKVNMEKYEAAGYASGSTLVCAFIDPGRRKIEMASLGDSRIAWLCDGIISSTRDHKPTASDCENKKFPCQIVDDDGVPRLNGELAIGRCVGDNTPELFGCVGRTPNFCSISYTMKQKLRLLLATDGLFDEMTEQACFATDVLNVNKTEDNVTAILIDFAQSCAGNNNTRKKSRKSAENTKKASYKSNKGDRVKKEGGLDKHDKPHKQQPKNQKPKKKSTRKRSKKQSRK